MPLRATAALSGPDLRVERLRARVTATDMARHFGATRQRIHHIESLAEVSPAAVERYVAALQKAIADRREQPPNVRQGRQMAEARALLDRVGASSAESRESSIPDSTDPLGSRWQRVPLFLHLRALKA